MDNVVEKLFCLALEKLVTETANTDEWTFDLFIDFLQHSKSFLAVKKKQTNKTIQRPVILLVDDGHSTHISLPAR